MSSLNEHETTDEHRLKKCLKLPVLICVYLWLIKFGRIEV